MDRRSGAVEDLPPLDVRPLRELTVEGDAPHLASASGVVRRADHLYVIADKRPELAVFSLGDPGPGALRQVLPVPGGAGKPDLEALTLLPPHRGEPFGSLLGLGSGSEDGRDRGFAWALDAAGGLRGEPRVLDLAPLYALLSRQIDGLNVEGAAVVGERLWLFHRGASQEGTSAVAELRLDAVLASLDGDLRVDPGELDVVRRYDLGTLDGVPLAFSDATPLADRIVVFTASAEAQGPSGGDGAICGSVVGTLTADGDVRRLRTIDRRWKVEGVHASIDTGVLDLLFVCDQDDPDVSSPLLAAAMPLDAAVER